MYIENKASIKREFLTTGKPKCKEGNIIIVQYLVLQRTTYWHIKILKTYKCRYPLWQELSKINKNQLGRTTLFINMKTNSRRNYFKSLKKSVFAEQEFFVCMVLGKVMGL